MGGIGWIEPAGPRRRRMGESEAREQRLARIDTAMRGSASALLGMRHADGYWCGELTADATLEMDYILLQLWLHPSEGDGWNPPSRARIDKACRSILDRQLPDGGWEIFAGGGAEVNATARAYAVLKICGHSPEADYMRRARERVLALGGLQAANSYTKINLSLFGLYPRKYTPTVPPEIVLVPGDVLYEMSSWTRAIIVPLSIVQAMGRHRLAPDASRWTNFTTRTRSSPCRAARAWPSCSITWTARSRSGRGADSRTCAAPPSAKPSTGFWTARATARGWAPSIRP